MSWQQSLARDQRDHFDRLLAAGPGWFPYVLDAAERLVRDEPMLHAGLVAHVEGVIGPKATAAARKALEWFVGRGRT